MLHRIEQALTRLERLLASASLLLLLLIALTQIVSRNLFDTGSAAADTLARHLVLYVVFFGAILAIGNNAHIRIDVVAHWIPHRHRRPLERIFQLLSASVCGLLAWAAVHFWLGEWAYIADYERWILLTALILPAGFILMALHFLLRALQRD